MTPSGEERILTTLMDMDEVKRILQLMEENHLVEFEYEDGGRRIKLRRAENRIPPPAAVTPPVALPAAASPPEPPPGGSSGVELVKFKSPLVGTFYRAMRPDAEPYVNVGDEVTPDKVLCIIEAMKVMNEIKAEMSGIVREILAKNSQAVEYGEPLFVIEKK